MVEYLNGEKLLTESDLPPQWNLISGTSNFDGFQLENVNLQSSKDIFGNQQALINNAWASAVKLINVFAGQIICFSALVQATDSSNLPRFGMFGGDSKYGGTECTNGKTINNQAFVDGINTDITPGIYLSDTKIHSVYGFFSITKSGLFNPRIETYDTHPLLYSSIKAELGNRATTWMPAVSDLMLKN